MRTIKLKDGKVEAFIVKGERNPCGCGSNVFHKEKDHDTNIVYGVCNACEKDIYEYEDNSDFEEWKYKNLSDLLTMKEKTELALYFIKGYKYIAKDINNRIQLSKELPKRAKNNWIVVENEKETSLFEQIRMGSYSFIIWDNEPYEINELLK